jgi:hypothetical protein
MIVLYKKPVVTSSSVMALWLQWDLQLPLQQLGHINAVEGAVRC